MMKGVASRPWLVVPMAAALHFAYAAGILYDPRIARITALHLASVLFDSYTPVALFAAGVIALVPMFKKLPAEYIHICLWPQQTLLFIMSASVLIAVANGRYPDGYSQTPAFIAVDQCWTVIWTVAHLAATLRNALYGRLGNGQLLR